MGGDKGYFCSNLSKIALSCSISSQNNFNNKRISSYKYFSVHIGDLVTRTNNNFDFQVNHFPAQMQSTQG